MTESRPDPRVATGQHGGDEDVRRAPDCPFCGLTFSEHHDRPIVTPTWASPPDITPASPEAPHPVVDFVRQAVASEPSLSWPGEIDTIIEDAEAFERSLAASPPDTGLDVERLARAMHESHPDQQSLDDAACQIADAHEATDLAERYARLAAPSAGAGTTPYETDYGWNFGGTGEPRE